MMVPDDERATVGSAATVGNESPSGTVVAASEAAGTVDEYIGSRLRQAYDAVAQEPVPDRFLQLIAALDKR